MKEMKSRNGGRSKRKPETNYTDPYKGGSSTLPSPPTMRDATAVPAKLLKIMQMKSSAADGHNKRVRQPQTDAQKPTREVGQQMLIKGQAQKNNPPVSDPAGSVVNNAGVTSPGINSKRASNAEDSISIAAKRKSTRRERQEAELSMLIEKMDQRNKTGFRKGVAPRRKSYLEAKKRKKGEQSAKDSGSASDFYQYDKVEFGETVQAPPKLSFPAKAAQVKKNQDSHRNEFTLNEKSRLQAIEAYRQQKGWTSRPGGAQLPNLNLTDAGR